ncbi:hypothetical protein JD844_033920 [Phrynosoma platyrhinos]|uniref:Uncharacterized protein n=1 Tax=Phrynosoma platyrhinos TaxID=52577 RepID=A0ABQ7T845_PHRPL|nr:hypothetical protein JD844_033920 [Phrynosoma platyrhinos]
MPKERRKKLMLSQHPSICILNLSACNRINRNSNKTFQQSSSVLFPNHQESLSVLLPHSLCLLENTD